MVDDDVLLREGLRSLLISESGIADVLEARDASGCLGILKTKKIDLVLLDIRLPGTNGLELLYEIRSLHPDLPVVVVTGLEGTELLVNLLKAGVNGIAFKLDGFKAVLEAINQVRSHGQYFPERILTVIKIFSHRWDHVPKVLLTYQEKEVLRAIHDGLTPKELAALLKLPENTAETYRGRLLKKVKVPNTAALLAFAYRNGLL